MGDGPPTYANVRTRDEPPPEPATPLIPPVGLKAQVLSATSVVLYWTDTTLSKSQVIILSQTKVELDHVNLMFSVCQRQSLLCSVLHGRKELSKQISERVRFECDD